MSVQPTFDIYGFEYRAVRLRNRLYFRLGPKDHRDARKIFVVGHPRTGTGTLHRIFVANGLDSSHTAGTWKTARHECFSDRGNYQPLARFADRYRNAEFVLNTRPAWKYLKSRMNQTVKKRTNLGLLQPRFTARNVANEILRRNNHFLDCLRLFDSLGDRFVIANIEREGAFDFICGHLDLHRENDVWTNKARPRLSEETVALIDDGFRLLGAEDERMNPFIIPQLLDDKERELVDDFLVRHAERVLL
jgi:hypothetical protein